MRSGMRDRSCRTVHDAALPPSRSTCHLAMLAILGNGQGLALGQDYSVELVEAGVLKPTFPCPPTRT